MVGVAVLPTAHAIFREFALASGLFLNIGKCVIAPLYPVALLAFRERLAAAVPAWAAITVADAAKHLGVCCRSR